MLLVYSVVPAFLNGVNKGRGPAYNNQASLPLYDLGVLYAHENTKKKRKKRKEKIPGLVLQFVLFSSPECAQFWVFSGTCVCLNTSHCHSLGFCIALLSN